MSRRTVYALVAVLTVATIIIGCESSLPQASPSGHENSPNKAYLDPSEVKVQAAFKSATNTDDKVLLPPDQGENLIIEKPKEETKYGRTRYDVAPQTRSSTLAVRGSKMESNDQKPMVVGKNN